MSKIPKALSPGEEAFALHCRVEGLAPQREWPVCSGRRWRYDFAFPDRKLAIEIEGGIFTQGGHTRGKGYERNLEKYNMAAFLGWTVLRYSTDMVLAGTAIHDVKLMLSSMRRTSHDRL
jgi:very-short-patch-repair endonuclease